eukprot:834904-Rhodomonas_salina.7
MHRKIAGFCSGRVGSSGGFVPGMKTCMRLSQAIWSHARQHRHTPGTMVQLSPHPVGQCRTSRSTGMGTYA